MADSSLDLRVSALEAAVRRIQSSSSTTTTSTTTSGGITYYPVTETALSLTQDGAWHDGFSCPVVPSDATYLMLSIKQDFHGNTAVTQEFRISSGSHSAYYIAAYADFHIGANGVFFQTQYLAPVGKTFSYFIGNDTDYIVTATVVGYFK